MRLRLTFWLAGQMNELIENLTLNCLEFSTFHACSQLEHCLYVSSLERSGKAERRSLDSAVLARVDGQQALNLFVTKGAAWETFSPNLH